MDVEYKINKMTEIVSFGHIILLYVLFVAIFIAPL